jgi:hypothetical protein
LLLCTAGSCLYSGVGLLPFEGHAGSALTNHAVQAILHTTGQELANNLLLALQAHDSDRSALRLLEARDIIAACSLFQTQIQTICKQQPSSTNPSKHIIASLETADRLVDSFPDRATLEKLGGKTTEVVTGTATACLNLVTLRASFAGASEAKVDRLLEVSVCLSNLCAFDMGLY